MRQAIRYAAAAVAVAAHAALEWLFPPRHVHEDCGLLTALEAENEVLEPGMLGVFEVDDDACVDVSGDGRMLLIKPDPRYTGTAEWSPFNADGTLRNLAAEGFRPVGRIEEKWK